MGYMSQIPLSLTTNGLNFLTTEGDDYTATIAVLTFMSGDMDGETQNATIPIVDDTLVERPEGVNVELVVGGMSADSGIFGIFDNDCKLKEDYKL